jgi:23S rRNA pseudouridine1911/1915/1917 synthase
MPPAEEAPRPRGSGAEGGAEVGAIEVTPQRAGATLAALVREIGPGMSWSRARGLCRGGRVRLDGAAVTDPALRPAAGSRVELLPPAGRGAAPAGSGGEPREPPLVVHADSDVVVLRKTAGVLTVPFERGDRDTLVALARVALRRRDAAGRVTLRAVQRLDRDTSGLVVFARTVGAQRRLQEQFAAHAVKRHYLAIAHGEVAAASYDTVLVEDRGDGLRGSWGAYRPARGATPAGGRRAITHVLPVESLAGATLVCCTLETGRQHQIRVHLAEAGHPLLGEKVYIRDYPGPNLPAPRPMLHAATLGFRHPRTHRDLLFQDPPPPDFEAVLIALRPAHN